MTLGLTKAVPIGVSRMAPRCAPSGCAGRHTAVPGEPRHRLPPHWAADREPVRQDQDAAVATGVVVRDGASEQLDLGHAPGGRFDISHQ